MSRVRNIVWTTALATVVMLGAACASSGRTPTISQVQTNPGRYADHTVTLEGVVTSSWGIPMVPLKVYRVTDGSGEILVVTDGSRVPSKNARVRVRGEVQEFVLIGGRSIGLHVREKAIKYL